ncbi:MAG TPA: PP0621 family protein [Burkholderiales bacterium]|nr:PP0621 family protein [Burkholderiales bacterium]
MGKIILLALGLLLVYWILRAYRRRVGRASAPPPPAAGEDMVQCAQCGVHLPRSESIAAQGAHYCSVEHQRAHRPQRRAG